MTIRAQSEAGLALHPQALLSDTSHCSPSTALRLNGADVVLPSFMSRTGVLRRVDRYEVDKLKSRTVHRRPDHRMKHDLPAPPYTSLHSATPAREETRESQSSNH
ncbi:hypothetical protein BO99DRAFT_259032 [Aspergillus violaceofuscus CBS 115571]|uniref:Uncharacterized protein n=1 Tax=Aspergillus violaceofuscus (strain CBS 115571) TaxID=1450538 RepID=A0A2V5IFJ1_ASPV1|nr:hypothetical protein BO99DRAFT_259032 [Aspergillus violaceofuscus CBS 115571]